MDPIIARAVASTKDRIRRAVKFRPCPFCGSADVFAERVDICVYRAFCNGCAAHGPPVEKLKYESHEGNPEADAAKAWNKRQ